MPSRSGALCCYASSRVYTRDTICNRIAWHCSHYERPQVQHIFLPDTMPPAWNIVRRVMLGIWPIVKYIVIRLIEICATSCSNPLQWHSNFAQTQWRLLLSLKPKRYGDFLSWCTYSRLAEFSVLSHHEALWSPFAIDSHCCRPPDCWRHCWLRSSYTATHH